MRKAIAGSVVVPDLEITMMPNVFPVRRCSSSAVYSSLMFCPAYNTFGSFGFGP